ncbi:MAG: hypothetical protein Q8N60_05350 [Candidatus Diapherotrites archaeon]|nr:hypothetical protein [Candidatus Diapherotrites archaeon]
MGIKSIYFRVRSAAAKKQVQGEAAEENKKEKKKGRFIEMG